MKHVNVRAHTLEATLNTYYICLYQQARSVVGVSVLPCAAIQIIQTTKYNVQSFLTTSWQKQLHVTHNCCLLPNKIVSNGTC